MDLADPFSWVRAVLYLRHAACLEIRLTMLTDDQANEIVTAGNVMREAAVAHGMKRTEVSRHQLFTAEDEFYAIVRKYTVRDSSR